MSIDLDELNPGAPGDAELAVPLGKLSKDLKAAAKELSRADARWLVDSYYDRQDERIRAGHRVRTNTEAGEPHALIQWVNGTSVTFESSIKSALGIFAKQYVVGQWMQAQCGIGPVLSAAMLSNFDIRKAQTVGHFWRFAGLDPTQKWEKGCKRPWNAQLKAICAFRLGECFVKTNNNPKSYYGKLYAEKKVVLAARNNAGEFAERAKGEIAIHEKNKAMHKTQRWGHWQAGLLAPAHIHDTARRWAVKLFLSHLHHVMFRDYYETNPPAPYIFEHPDGRDHRHLLLPPLWPSDEYDGRRLTEMKD